MKRILKFFKKLDYKHYIASAITLVFVALAIFVFPDGIVRIWESIQDLFWSVCYYFNDLMDLGFEVNATVNEWSAVPWTPIWGLPATWEEFQIAWARYWNAWWSVENLAGYVNFLIMLLQLLMPTYTLLIFLFFAFYKWFDAYLSEQNNDYNEDSKAVIWAKKFGSGVYIPCRDWTRAFIAFLRQSPYPKLWLLIWFYNFNFITIIIEFFAYYFYFVITFDVLNLYRQLVKLFCDLSPMIAFVPGWIWAIVAFLVFDKARKNIAYSVLYMHEARNCGFINERPIVSMACGTMGKSKTTMITDMALLQEKMFREKAFELMRENELKFPDFPWCNLELFLKRAFDSHLCYNLATIRRVLDHFEWCFIAYHSTEEYSEQRVIRRHLKRRYGVYVEDMPFGYDITRYSMTYDDKLQVVDIWSVIKAYAQEYFIYSTSSSLIISNYAIRTDSIIDDVGNLPIRDNDFYQRNSAFIYEVSRYSNIIDYDSMRLGKKVVDNNPKKDFFEFGVVVETEKGKERKNTVELMGVSKKDSDANQKNDGYNYWLKLIRHSATIDYVPFVKVFTDEQRPESWGADARDLCEIIHIRDAGPTQLALPFFAAEELFYDLVYSKFAALRDKYRYIRSDNTLPMFIMRKLMGLLQRYYKGVYNLFGYKVLKVQVESGTQDGELDDRVYFLDNKRIYSDRFSTDAYSDYFNNKALRSKVGIEDLEEYGSSKATMDELRMQHSYFVADLINKQENDK